MSNKVNLPVGYLDMGREEYAALDVSVLRAIFSKMRDIVRYTAGTEDADSAIHFAMSGYDEMSGVEWIMAVKRVVVPCARCRGTGIYQWGACINGRMSHSAPCARCAGKGCMTFDDMRRGRAYDNYSVRRAFGF